MVKYVLGEGLYGDRSTKCSTFRAQPCIHLMLVFGTVRIRPISINQSRLRQTLRRLDTQICTREHGTVYLGWRCRTTQAALKDVP